MPAPTRAMLGPMPNGDAVLLVPMTLGGVEVLVQATPGTRFGSEPTSAASKVRDAFADAEETIQAVADSLSRTVTRLRQSAAPSSVEIEFGIGVTVSGNAVVVSGSSEASLLIRLVYDGSRQGD